MIRKKLVSKGGLTLTEVLVAVLVFVLLSIVIVYGTTAALHIYRKGVMASEARTLTATLAQSLSSELRYAQNVRVADDGTVTFDSREFGADASIKSDGGRVQIVSGGKAYDLLGNKAYTSGLQAQVTVTYENGLFTIDLTVSNTYVSQTTQLRVGSFAP